MQGKTEKEKKQAQLLAYQKPEEQRQSSGSRGSANCEEEKEVKEQLSGEKQPQPPNGLNSTRLKRRSKQRWRNEPKWRSVNEMKMLKKGLRLEEKANERSKKR